jgi:hypothetical protein
MIQLGGKRYTLFSLSSKLVGLIKICLDETYSRVLVGKNLSDYSLPLQRVIRGFFGSDNLQTRTLGGPRRRMGLLGVSNEA